MLYRTSTFDRITTGLSHRLLDHFMWGNPSQIYKRVYCAVERACYRHCYRYDLALWGTPPITYTLAANFVDPF